MIQFRMAPFESLHILSIRPVRITDRFKLRVGGEVRIVPWSSPILEHILASTGAMTLTYTAAIISATEGHERAKGSIENRPKVNTTGNDEGYPILAHRPDVRHAHAVWKIGEVQVQNSVETDGGKYHRPSVVGAFG